MLKILNKYHMSNGINPIAPALHPVLHTTHHWLSNKNDNKMSCIKKKAKEQCCYNTQILKITTEDSSF